MIPCALFPARLPAADGWHLPLQLSILRLYVVQAIEANKSSEVQSFYAAFGEQLSSGKEAAEWEPWFSLPFLQKPQKHPRFQASIPFTLISKAAIRVPSCGSMNPCAMPVGTEMSICHAGVLHEAMEAASRGDIQELHGQCCAPAAAACNP